MEVVIPPKINQKELRDYYDKISIRFAIKLDNGIVSLHAMQNKLPRSLPPYKFVALQSCPIFSYNLLSILS